MREFVKPGKAGAVHDKAESVFVQAMSRAKWPTHYMGLTSLSGKPRALFLTWYDSFEAWQKDSDAVAKNAALNASIDRAVEADERLRFCLSRFLLAWQRASGSSSFSCGTGILASAPLQPDETNVASGLRHGLEPVKSKWFPRLSGSPRLVPTWAKTVR